MAREKRSKALIKDKLLKRMQRRLWFIFGVVCVLFVVLIVRIMYIQYTSGFTYEKQVLSQMSYDSRVIPYQRGNITDTNGTVLATSVDVYNLVLDCRVLNANPDAIDSTIATVTSVYPEVDPNEIREYLENDPRGQYHVLIKKMPYSQMRRLADLMESDEDIRVAGIWFEQEYKREYPYGSMAASTIGFAGGDGNGAIGLENGYNKTLSGINGRSYGYLNDDNNLERTVIEPENGKTLVTTIDINIQSIVEEEIRLFNEEMSMAADNGMDGSLNTAVLVMDPRTGAVLAMADYPSFDLNDPRNLTSLYPQEFIDTLSAEEKMNELNRLWQNFTITHAFEPGSTYKAITIAAGLETGILSGEEEYFCDGHEVIGEHDIHCVNRNGHGMETLEDALSDSCNDALMQISYVIGADIFETYQRLFGFGQRTNIDLTGEARTDNLLYTNEQLQRVANLATSSFGQGFNVTMIQMASAYCSIINGGNLYQPYVVAQVMDANGNVIEKTNPVIQKKTVSRETSELLCGYLETVVSEGTGSLASVPGYRIGGKTGTAEKAARDKENYLVSFIGFAPVDDPQVLIYVVVDQPNVLDQAHSTYAQQIAHNIFIQILPYLNIPSVGETETAPIVRIPAVDPATLPEEELEGEEIPEDAVLEEQANETETVAEQEEPAPQEQ